MITERLHSICHDHVIASQLIGIIHHLIGRLYSKERARSLAFNHDQRMNQVIFRRYGIHDNVRSPPGINAIMRQVFLHPNHIGRHFAFVQKPLDHLLSNGLFRCNIDQLLPYRVQVALPVIPPEHRRQFFFCKIHRLLRLSAFDTFLLCCRLVTPVNQIFDGLIIL